MDGGGHLIVMARGVLELLFDLGAGAERANVALNGRWTPFILDANPASPSRLYPVFVMGNCFIEDGEVGVDHVASEVPMEAFRVDFCHGHPTWLRSGVNDQIVGLAMLFELPCSPKACRSSSKNEKLDCIFHPAHDF